MPAKFLYIGHLRKSWVSILLLQLITLLLYCTVFSSTYLYTDEAVQLWNYRNGSGFHMFLEQGRYLTDQLMAFFFSKADSIADLRYIRAISLAGWLAAIPVWYIIIRNILRTEGLRHSISFLVVLWLVCSPTVTISIGWASCFELSLAYTTGLISGYCYYQYRNLPYGSTRYRNWLPFFSIVTGLIAMFSYQNGIGCFFLPFFIQAIAGRTHVSKTLQALLFAALIAVIYYLLFRYQLKVHGINASVPTATALNPLDKLRFFFTKPFVAAWFFGLGYNETERKAILYAIPVILLAAYASIRLLMPGLTNTQKLIRFAVLLLLCVTSWFPSLLVKENYAATRTTLALSVMVFTWVAVLVTIRRGRSPFIYRGSLFYLSIIFIVNAVFNYHFRFRRPLEIEYREAMAAFVKGYDPASNSFSWTRPPENEFEKRYGLARSWDEFAVPSLFFPWVPEFFFRQVLYENTGDRARASALKVNVSPL